MSLRKFLLALLFFWLTAANAGELTDADNLTAHDFEFKARCECQRRMARID